MFFSALMFLVGICSFFYSPAAPGDAYLWSLAGVPLLLSGRPVLRATGALAAGVLWAGWQAGQVTSIRLPAELEGQDIRVQGVVQDLPVRTGPQQLRFVFRIERIDHQGEWRTRPLPVRLSWYRHAPLLQAGERWQLTVRLKRPRGFSNPGGFDYERWLFAQRIRATGYVRTAAANRRLPDPGSHPAQRLRQHLAVQLEQVDTTAATRALLRGLAIGDRSGMSPAQWQVLRDTGTSHLLAISGLHIGMVAGLAFLVTRRAWGLSGLAERWPAPRAAALSAMLAALAYALLAGFQVPAQRALVMVCIWSLALLWNGRADPWRVWSLALLAVLLLDPLAVLGAGFWLSFAAVGLIFLLTLGRHGKLTRLQRLTGVQLGLVFGLTPLLWLWFQQLSLTAPLANLVAIPWVGLLVVPLLLSGLLLLPLVPVLADWLLEMAAFSLAALWWLLDQLAALPAGLWQAPPLAASWLLLLGVATLCLLLPAAMRLWPVAVLLLLPVFTLHSQRPQTGDLWLTLLDVGQGLSVVLETRGHLLVYDTGPAFRSGFNTGTAVVAPYLVQQGYRQIDRLVVSHADNDHSGGAASLFNQFDILSVQGGEPGKIPWARSTHCRAGQHWQWDAVSFEYLAPFATGSGNNASCVLRIETAAGRVVLLPGDIERSVEQQLLELRQARLAADILVAPHHGSRTSSGAGFIAAVRPELVLFAVGYRNRFGFPKPDVQARYRAAGATLLDTARNGAIHIRLEAGRQLTPAAYRLQNAPLWRALPPDRDKSAQRH